MGGTRNTVMAIAIVSASLNVQAEIPEVNSSKWKDKQRHPLIKKAINMNYAPTCFFVEK